MAVSRALSCMRRRFLAACLAVLSVLPLVLRGDTAPVAADSGPPPFVAASAGPEASSRIDATVTRRIGDKRVTLPAAVVPALKPGDDVDVRFSDYMRPPARANYHVNVAFITEAPPLRWLYEKSGTWDQLFANRRSGTSKPRDLSFTYGEGDHRGIPIFFIVPEDEKTRGMDGVRDYVDAHPTDFKNMSQSANTAVDRYNWFQDFLHSLAVGSLNPLAGGNAVTAVAASLGANPSTIATCYSQGATQSQVATCIETTLGSVQYQANINAPTEAQFFGGLAGAAVPTQLASYLVSLLGVWQIFLHTGHQEYEYLPASLDLATPSSPGGTGEQLLMGLKVPALRPPAATSDVLFFTIGDPQAAATPPVVVNGSSASGMCASTSRVEIPLHLDRTSTYVHDTSLLVTPDRGASYTIPIDPHSIAAPTIERSALAGADDGGYTVRLAGRFGFDPVVQPDRVLARIAVPRAATWSVAPFPNRNPIAGRTLDVIASSAAAPCLSQAEVQIGSAPAIPLQIKRLDDRRVELQAALKDVPPGEARIRFYQDDLVGRTEIENTATLAIAAQPAQVDPSSAPVAYLGDAFITLSGTGFESISGVRLGATTYTKAPSSTSTLACFTGPSIGGNGLEAGESISTQLVPTDGSTGEVFVSKLAAARPVLLAPIVAPDAPVHLSSEPLAVELATGGADLPAQREIRVRRAVAVQSPCDVVRADTSYSVVAPADTHIETPSRLAVYLHPADELHDNAFGTLQIQLVDTQTKSASDWATLPGSFVRTPTISKIECSADPSAPCTLLGTGLGAITGVDDASGHVVPPGIGCTSDQKGLDCLSVPHLAHYTLQLQDAKTPFSVPDSAITNTAKGGSSPEPR